jgi:outer membrane protein
MHKIYKFLTVFFFIIFTTGFVQANEVKIFYVDIDKIIKESNVGKKVDKKIQSLITKKNKEFKKTEEDLKKKDSELVKQKNILSKDELSKKIKDLENDIKNYRTSKNNFNKNISQKKLKATSEMVVYLNRILGKYATDNSATLIIQKKNIVIGKTELDITKPILKIFNEEVKDVKLN